MKKIIGAGEWVADGLAVATGMYATWTLGFQKPKVPVVHEALAVLGTLGVGYLLVKLFRSIRLTTPR